MKKIYILYFLLITTICNAQSVNIYTVCQFNGEGANIDKNIPKLSASWNDRINSIYIPDGMIVKVFEHDNYGGKSKVLSSNWDSCNDLSWQNKISSIQIFDTSKPRIGIYTACDKNGESASLENDMSKLPSSWNDKINSIKVPYGIIVVIYEHSNYGGKYKVIERDWSSCNDLTWQNNISSIKFYKK